MSSIKTKSSNHNQILEGRPYLTFVNSLKSAATRKAYIFFLKKYMQFLNVATVEELLQTANDVKLIESQIIDLGVYFLYENKQIRTCLTLLPI